MRVVGVFRELTPKKPDFLPAIHEAKGKLSAEEALEVAAYLRKGVAIVDFMDSTRDPFEPTRSVPGASSLLSDGSWVWRHDLVYYVERYRVGLPSEFLQHVRSESASAPNEAGTMARRKEALAAYQRYEKEGA